MKATKTNLIKLAMAHGLNEVDDIDETHNLSKQGFDMSFHAPAGFCWSIEQGLHVIVASQWSDETREACIQDAIDRISQGIEPCQCEGCNS